MIYDRFQQEAIDFINAGHSVIVSAPTGAGKTVIAEHVIAQCLQQGSKVIYTAPIKALSNQKYREFQETSPDKVGILTGDITLNAHAPVLIMTTEIFRNKILEENSSLADYSWIIFDEIHYLDDYERGSVWEESLIFLPEHMRFLGLSATVPNIDQISSWLESIHGRPVKIVTEKNRPVPLHFYFQCQSEVYDDLKKLAREGYRSAEWRYRGAGKLPRHAHVKANRLHPLISHLKDNAMLPCIYFAFSRKLTEQLAGEIMDFQFLEAADREEIARMYDELCRKFDLTHEESAHELKPYIERGIAYHHAGMLPTLKEVVERLFTSRRIKMIFTTETFALGINMPAKTVIFDELRKFYGRAFATLKTRDFYQMAGRAGRRSIDTEGHVFSRVNPHYIGPEELHSVIYSQPEKVQSQFNASYATILNLYQHYQEQLYDIYPRSFHYYQVRKHLRKRAVNLMRAKVAILKEMRCIHHNRLTKKGEFAARVYGYEMILSELYDEGFLEELSVQELGLLCIAVVFEPRKGAHKPHLDRKAKTLESKTEKIIRRVNKMERAGGMKDLSKFPAFHLSPAMEAWMKGEPFREILKHTNSDEGEIVRYMRMTIQVLREIAETPVTEELRGRLFQLIGSINRDVVDSEKQLRG